MKTAFEDLKVYQDSISLMVKIVELLKKEELRKEFSFNDQLKRASLSISNNIAEGFERETDKELIRFLYFSKGSAGEVRNILNVFYKLNYIQEKEYTELKDDVLNISRQLSNYIKYVVKRNYSND